MAELEERFYDKVTRYSGAAFTRMKLAPIVPGVTDRPHLFRGAGRPG